MQSLTLSNHLEATSRDVLVEAVLRMPGGTKEDKKLKKPDALVRIRAMLSDPVIVLMIWTDAAGA